VSPSVLALGIGCSFHRRSILRHPRQLAPHSSALTDLSQFRGKRIAVLEKARVPWNMRILHENKADVAIITRAAEVKFHSLAWRKHLFRQLMAGPLRPLPTASPPTDLGDIHTARKMADPKSSDVSLGKLRIVVASLHKPAGAIGCLPGLKVFR